MKYFATFALVLLLGAGCMGGAPADTTADETETGDAEVQPEIMATNPQSAWNSILKTAENEDCEAFLSLMTDRLGLTEEDCRDFFDTVKAGVPEIDWSLTEQKEDTAKIFIDESRSMTTMRKGDDGVWRADTVFWR